jgi:hypothetical protein
MRAIDPRAKAAECDRAIERVSNPEHRVVLETLRNLWMDLSNQRRRATNALEQFTSLRSQSYTTI